MKAYSSKNTRKNSDTVQTVIEDGECRIISITGKNGDVVNKSYSVFPGITLIYQNVHMQEFEEKTTDGEKNRNVYEINHCSKGRIETSAGNHFFYLAPGDLSIHKRNGSEKTSYFPTSHYHGISILIDTDCAPKCLSCLLNDVDVHPDILLQKFCGSNGLFVARSNEHLQHVFSELYHIPEEVRKGYLEIKVLEIFLFLSCVSPDAGSEKQSYTASQVSLAKQVCKFLACHIEDRITIEDLCRVFHVSSTQLKNCFKGVYGASVYGYIRSQKMQRAASMLLTTDKTVLEIANLHSYDNASKFAKAFSDVMGMSPTEYRKQNITEKQ